jgi:shikimate kinase/3-dehydroquinate synthase
LAGELRALSPATAKLVFIGFMGAGKSTLAARAATALSLPHKDRDELVATRAAKPVERIFAEDGEAAFRASEERVVLELLDEAEPSVLSLGGGAVLSERVRTALRAHHSVWLEVDGETAWARAQGTGRPLAAEPEAFTRLLSEREPLYREAARAVAPAGEVREPERLLASLQVLPQDALLLWASSASAEYPVLLGADILAGGFGLAGLEGRRFLVTDGHVGRLYGERIEPLAGRVTIMPGEQSKTVAHAEIVWTELARGGMTRRDLVVALGGGVVGDLAGFCAATYQRGVRYVQVPTTLVAQVDSSLGGKTGVDLAEAKNYVGAFHQPAAVLADAGTLVTLPPEELAAGYAEVVKTALIAGGELWRRVREGAEPDDPEVIAACARTKLRIVGRDERDGGLRQVLNLGHTVGHAIETVTGYARYRHGEAVALGLLAALRLSGQEALRVEVAGLLGARGLPTELRDVDPDAVVMATARDKKRLGDGPVPFVLLRSPGAPQPGCAVGSRELIGAVRELSRP